MALKNDIEAALARVRDQQSFFSELLSGTLEWPLGDVSAVEDIAYAWSAEDLRAADLERSIIEGRIWQIQSLRQDQPWGIFVLEFKNPEALGARRGMASALRKVLRGLVASRLKVPGLPSWKREHLLFISTYQWRHFRFAYFRSKHDDPQASRLASFGWSPETSNRTVCEFNLPPLRWPDDPSNALAWVSAWATAFDKEPLTKDFFRRFDECLDAIKSDLEQYQKLPSAEAYSQAQLLLERLIFLYFLQNRGWLNQDSRYLGDKLKEYTPKPDVFTYYGDFLDKLFWTLATAPGSPGRLAGIPFLNGGLFDDDEFRQPAETRKANPLLKVRNATFGRVFDELLESFNFTVTEDTPLTQDVAVDPEMLGKVFESIVLRAEESDPDATAPNLRVDKRKATGSYYTPRIVVHFICREVLYQYLLSHLPADPASDGWGPRLKTLLTLDASDGVDEEKCDRLKLLLSPAQAVQILDLVKPLRCCDPAVGSGAFPVGLMHELVNLRRLLTTVANGYVDPVRKDGAQWLHDTKEEIVQNCLFGVDIQQQAIEICRLRLWLSLVVDYDLGLDPFRAERNQFSAALARMSQLPNLEMNFHRGDSLHDHVSGVPIVIIPERASRYAKEFGAIARLGDRLHRAKSAEIKKKFRLEILEKRLDVSRSIIEDEMALLRTRDSALDGLFGLEESASEKRKRNEQELKRLEEALRKVGRDREELERLRDRPFDNQFYPKLRQLEGADFDSPFNFAWRLDFPNIFSINGGGFDIIVGNPPFVTARNPVKRELWRLRWPRVCAGTYQLVCPFFELGMSLLRTTGQLGFIVSNAFAKRKFGKPLLEAFFPTVGLQKIVDCSGLLFPGHGTPTCLIFVQEPKPVPDSSVRVAAVLPGGGDLRTPPEDSPLWHSLAEHHDQPGFQDSRIVVADRSRQELARWPLNLDASTGPTAQQLEARSEPLSRFVVAYGSMFDTHKDDVYMVSAHFARQYRVELEAVAPFAIGDQIRNWQLLGSGLVLTPYDGDWRLRKEDRSSRLFTFLRHFRQELGGRATFSGGTYDQAGQPWYRYHQISQENITAPFCVIYPEISTHGHFVLRQAGVVFTQTAPLVRLKRNVLSDNLLVTGMLNSSAALFWLKIKCFNKGAGEVEHLDRFEYAGEKVAGLPVPDMIGKALRSQPNGIVQTLTELSRACWERGQQMPGLALEKLFEKRGEAYQNWNSSLPGYIAPSAGFGPAFESAESLRQKSCKALATRERVRAQIIALQEEIDWLVYAAYGLLPESHPAVAPVSSQANGDGDIDTATERLDREQRPFRLWANAEGDFRKAIALIPCDWPDSRKTLWEARLAAIRDNEHIRRIEQPVYKRRWDEQWKVKNQWRCGPVAYAAEFLDAFEWWLREKAEWWLEHKKTGGPVELDDWAAALWRDSRVQAAWEVAAENYAFLSRQRDTEETPTPVLQLAAVGATGSGVPFVDDPPEPLALPGMDAVRKPRQRALRPTTPATPLNFSDFRQVFKRIVDEDTVPENIPWAVPYEKLEQKIKIPAKVRSVRGKLNVPRERFHLRNRTQYLWAGLQFRN